MARPRKQEVDYFPHYCDHGKTLFILESRFQNDGYAVFYKLEEILAKTEGHCYDCSLLENWEYFLSKMNTTEEIVIAIIDKLVAMNVIDGPLWQEKRLWMQSFVDSISDAYTRRKVDAPVKPELMSTLIPLSGQKDDINPQSKVKESKVKKSSTFPDGKPTQDFLESLKKNSAYQHINFETELAKMDAWLLLPKNKRRKKTPTFILNWLNKIEAPLNGNGIAKGSTYGLSPDEEKFLKEQEERENG
jgi:hypothetical protein